MTQDHLVIDFPIRGPANAKALTEELSPLMPDLAKVQDDLGTVQYSSLSVEEEEKLLFLSDIDRKERGSVLNGWWRVVARCLTPLSSMRLILRRLRWLLTVRMLSGG